MRKYNALEVCIINRKSLIKRINQIRKERKEILDKTRVMAEQQAKPYIQHVKVLNARLSELWAHYNDIVKTQKLLEDGGMTSQL